jgi:alkanesulfonate monooxygenase SsuD/methylene tetrahydromethanopterin reductase-like flavin-dependent oxidoreductase (luciferase family)
MKDNISLSILEFGDRGNENSLSAVNQIIEYAIKVDELNYTRFWLGEHHGPDPRVPYTNPEILLTIIAGMTERIRVGSAGTLVKMYNPYNVVTNFKLLNNLFSNRIDLGLAKGNPDTKYLRSIIDFDEIDLFKVKIEEINKLMHDEVLNFDKNEIVIPPFKGEIPQAWYLSNTYNKFNDAIKYKLNFCRSLIHGQSIEHKRFDKEKLLSYKESFYTVNNYYPQVSLAIGISIGKTIEDAKRKFEKTYKDEGVSLSEIRKIIPVTINSLFDLVHKYKILYGIDEFVLFDIESNNEQKINNISEIAEKFKLT